MRTKVFTVTLGRKFAEMLELYSETKQLKKKLVIETFIAEGVKYDIVEQNWTEELRRDIEIEREKAEARSGCSALAISTNLEKKKDYRCVWYRIDKPPQIRKLGNTKKMQKAACLACGRTGEVVAKLKARDSRIVELETGLRNREREVYKIPVCEGGAHLISDGTGFERCRKSNIPVDVLRYCKVVEDGPCAYFREVVVGVGEKR